jgi:hypothetical protein
VSATRLAAARAASSIVASGCSSRRRKSQRATELGALTPWSFEVLGLVHSLIAFLTAGVTNTVFRLANAEAQAVTRAHAEREAKTVLDALVETQRAIIELDARLDRIEAGGLDDLHPQARAGRQDAGRTAEARRCHSKLERRRHDPAGGADASRRGG